MAFPDAWAGCPPECPGPLPKQLTKILKIHAANGKLDCQDPQITAKALHILINHTMMHYGYAPGDIYKYLFRSKIVKNSYNKALSNLDCAW
ncbi:hypothetical protein BDP27DRAFT_715521 [Rhodocollybia butyracea]|uniref:Uncharacterized protein n=1 Tax=Rhodocollybia butyracea TaxID=206335 RepID=A0A9P5Q9C0_9AGAR|nr:hypothetical protein BDP27DRAFT_715521 [Rhodocollybia butyracea]